MTIAEIVAEQRHAQGLAPTVSDPIALRHIANLLGAGNAKTAGLSSSGIAKKGDQRERSGTRRTTRV